MVAKEPTVERRHRLLAIELAGGPGACCRRWAEDGVFEASLHVRPGGIAQALANAETAASEKTWDEGFIAGVNHQLRFNDALDDGELDLLPPVNPYRQPAKGDGK